jgi:HEAT repeat protein
MAGIKKVFALILAMGLVEGMTVRFVAGQVIHYPRPDSLLAERVDWAFQEAGRAGLGKGFWVGFSIRRLMGEHSFIGSHFSGSSDRKLPLEELVYGRKTAVEKRISNEQAVREAVEKALTSAERGKPERTVLKDIAILMKFASAAARQPEMVTISNLSLSASLQSLPLLWLGPAEDADSFSLIKKYYEKAATDRMKKTLLQAVALHQNAALVVPLLEGVLKSRESVKIRADAAAFLGEQNDGRALEILIRTIRTDASLEVRKNAVWGLTEMELAAAVDALIDFARNSPEKDIRTEAVEALAEKATQQAVRTLEQIVFNDKETEVQTHAVHALADLPAKEGLPYLIRVAKTHSNREVRKAAIYSLGDMNDPAAIQALVDIVKGKS